MGADLAGGAVVDRRGGVQPYAGVAVGVVVVIEEHHAERSGVFDAAEPAGERGAVLEGLELGFAVGGLSLETCGRLWLRATPRSTSSWATGLEVIDVPRSACTVSWSRPMPRVVSMSAMNASASSPVSAG